MPNGFVRAICSEYLFASGCRSAIRSRAAFASRSARRNSVEKAVRPDT